jgi:CO/xanthine dehydrogenase FAD-binding subunit
MRPAPFVLEMPTELDQAVDLLADSVEDTVLLAGGQTLIPLLNMRLSRPDRVIDLGGIAALSGLREEAGEIAVGAMTRQAQLETSELVAQRCPLLGYVTRFVGQPQTRSRGTVGGSIALASAYSELCVALLAMDGRVRARGRGQQRWIEAGQLFQHYFTTSLAPHEVLTEVRFPVLAPEDRWGFSELKLRACDFPIVVALVVITLQGDTCVRARLALGGAAVTPVRIEPAEALLVGGPVDEQQIRRAAALAGELATPADDLHAPAAYRRRATVVEVARALRMAAAGVGARR